MWHLVNAKLGSVWFSSGVCVCFFYFESLLNWFACKNELNQSVMQANGQLFEMKLSYFRPIGWTKILNFSAMPEWSTDFLWVFASCA